MFQEFSRKYQITAQERSNPEEELVVFDSIIERSGCEKFLWEFGGATFNRGVYRVHNPQDLSKWNQLIGAAFPKYSSRISCFSYDWLGRHFALDKGRLQGDQPLILLLEPGTGEALEIPETFEGFHKSELVNFADAALAERAFQKWIRSLGRDLKHSECVSYKVPLFLGAKDSPENFEISDLEVYWHVSGQLLNKTCQLPEGSRISSIKTK